MALVGDEGDPHGPGTVAQAQRHVTPFFIEGQFFLSIVAHGAGNTPGDPGD